MSTAANAFRKKIRVTVVAADGLSKRDVFRLPDPFAVITVDAEQTHTTSVVKRTLYPYWNESFDIAVENSSVVAVQIFDQRKSKQRDGGFLGVVNVKVSDALDLNLGGHEMLTLDLKESNDNLVAQGKLIIYLSTNVNQPMSNPGPTQVQGVNSALANMGMNESTISLSSTDATSELGPLPSGWGMRLTPTARVYFVNHNTKTTTWDDPRMPSALDANVPQYKRDFRRKLIYIQSQPAMRVQPGNCQIKVRRNHIFEDSYAQIMGQTSNDLKKRLMIKFDGEDGLDDGGLSWEFFFLLSDEMFNPLYCLFEYSTHNNYTLQINPASGVNPEHLNYFKFIGRCLGLAIFHRCFLDAYFIFSFYKMILKKEVTLSDLESVDAQLHSELTWMLENDVTDVIDETFTTTEERFGELVTIELRPGGADVDVTEENKKEYVDAVVEYRISKRVKDQSDAFMSGFSELIPQDIITVFDEREIDILINDTPNIDVDDWMKHTKYRGYEMNDEVIHWFWMCIRSWPPQRKFRLLQFATGTSRIPVYGFKNLQGSDGPRHFTIHKSGDPSHLLKSYTPFNRIDLPPYEDYATMEQKLMLAVEETFRSSLE